MGCAATLFWPYGPIAAFGSDYRFMYSYRHKEEADNQPHADKPHNGAHHRPIGQIANDVKQAAGDKQHGQYINRHWLGVAHNIGNDHCRGKRGGYFKAVELSAMSALGKPVQGFNK